MKSVSVCQRLLSQEIRQVVGRVKEPVHTTGRLYSKGHMRSAINGGSPPGSATAADPEAHPWSPVHNGGPPLTLGRLAIAMLECLAKGNSIFQHADRLAQLEEGRTRHHPVPRASNTSITTLPSVLVLSRNLELGHPLSPFCQVLSLQPLVVRERVEHGGNGPRGHQAGAVGPQDGLPGRLWST